MEAILHSIGEYFRHPAYVVFGALAALAPLLIYLLFRWKMRRTQWGAMVFLLRARAKLKKRLQIQQFIMLLVRTVLIVVIACALARPMLKRGALVGERNGLAVILMDVSYSMGALGPSGKPLMETAKENALAVLQALGEGDRVAIVTMGSSADVALKPDPDRSLAMTELRRIETTDGSTDLARGVKAVTELMESVSAATRMVYLITDLQGNAWKPARAKADLEAALDKLARMARVTVMDVNSRADRKNVAIDNAAVTSLSSGDDLIAEGMPAQFAAELMNYSGHPRRLTVEWEVAGVHREHPSEIEIPAKPEPVAVEWKYTFKKAGSYKVAVRIRENGHAVGVPADDERLLAVQVREAVHVLVVQGGDKNLDLFDREAGFLVLALQPEDESPDKRISVASRDVLSEAEIATARLGEHDVVILANVRIVPADIARKLESFVQQGGGLLVFLGDNVDTAAYNMQLYKNGSGLLPAELTTETGPGKRAPGQEPSGESVGLDPQVHAVTASMRSGDYGQPKDAAVRTYIKVRRPGKVICKYTNGDPAVLENKFGRGSVVMVTTACDRDWGDLPVQPLYAPFIQDCVRYLVRKQRLNTLVGEKWTKALSANELGYAVTVTGPDGKVFALQPEVKDDETVVTHEKTDRRGFYHVGIGNGSELTFAANVDTDEGLPERLDDDAIRKLFPKFEHAYLESSQDIKRSVRELMAGSDLSKIFLCLALAVACMEVTLTYAFRKERAP